MSPSPNRTALISANLILLALLAAAATTAWLQHTARDRTPDPHPIDIGFAQSMSMHHQQAIGMANLMLDGRPTRLGTLARGIAAEQLLELGEMRGWLRLWQAPLVSGVRQDMNWMLLGKAAPNEVLLQYLLDCERSPTGMAGLATNAELEQLRQLDGPARDALFVKLMLAHHQGGLPMARFAADEAAHPAVRELATRVVLEQSKELIVLMRLQQTLAVEAPALQAAP